MGGRGARYEWGRQSIGTLWQVLNLLVWRCSTCCVLEGGEPSCVAERVARMFAIDNRSFASTVYRDMTTAAGRLALPGGLSPS